MILNFEQILKNLNYFLHLNNELWSTIRRSKKRKYVMAGEIQKIMGEIEKKHASDVSTTTN
jgi:hypothetical protein